MKIINDFRVALMVIVVAVLCLQLITPFVLNEENTYFFDPLYIVAGLAQTIAFVIIIQEGTTIKTRYFNFIKFCLGFFIIGVLFKVMHWTGGIHLIALSLIAITIIYIFAFLDKPYKRILDGMKVLCVVTRITETILVLYHLVSRDVLIYSNLIAWITILIFIYEARKKDTYESK